MNPPFDPELLIGQARAGDEGARGQLLEGFRNYLRLLARLQVGRRMQGRVDASDVVQETFLVAHRDFTSFRGDTEAELAAWLRTILSARFIDQWRRHLGSQRRDARLEAGIVADIDHSSRAIQLGVFAPGSTPSQKAVRREQAVLLADRIRALPEDYGEVIVLHHLEGLTFPEVARRMGRTLDSVKKLWVRALARLRQDLGELQ